MLPLWFCKTLSLSFLNLSETQSHDATSIVDGHQLLPIPDLLSLGSFTLSAFLALLCPPLILSLPVACPTIHPTSPTGVPSTLHAIRKFSLCPLRVPSKPSAIYLISSSRCSASFSDIGNIKRYRG